MCKILNGKHNPRVIWFQRLRAIYGTCQVLNEEVKNVKLDSLRYCNKSISYDAFDGVGPVCWCDGITQNVEYHFV